MQSFLKRRRLWAILCLTCLLLASNLLVIQAQETTPEPTVEITPEPVIPTAETTEIPTEVPADTTPEVTPVAPETVEPIPTEAVTEEPTVEVTPTVEGELPPEPALVLLVRELFDNGDLSPWALTADWSLAGAKSGAGLQVVNNSEPARLLKGAFYNVSAEISFLITTGSAQIGVRQSVAGDYTASIDSTGLVQLLRAGQVVEEGAVQAPAGAWHKLSISAIDGAVRVSVDDVLVIQYADAAALPPGDVTIGAVFPVAPEGTTPTNVTLFDEFFLRVPQSEASLYPSPTPQSTSVPVESTPEATTEVTPESTPEATLEVTPETTAEATEAPIVTEEPTAEVTEVAPEATPEAGPVDGKAAAEPPSEEELVGALATGNDDFANASTVPAGTLGQVYLPYNDSGDSTGNDAGREANEPSPNCGYNISYTFWYKFTPANTASYIFTTAGSQFDTIVAVYKGNSLTGAAATNINTAANKLGCNDDAALNTFTSQVTVALTAGTEYRIQVGGYDGAWGDFQLKIMQSGVPAPGVPVLDKPGAAWTINDTTPTLSWLTSLNGYRYELQVDNNSNFSSPEITQSGVALTSYTTGALTDGIYYWRVRALNVNDLASAYSAARAFTVRTTAPVQNLPAAGALSTTTRPTFTWTAYPGATKYHVVINDNNDCTTTPVFEKNDVVGVSLALLPTVRPQPLLPGAYYWCVKAYDVRNDPATSWGLFSAPRAFNVNILTAPLDNATTTDTTPLFSWTASTVAVGSPAPQYRLEIDNDANFGSLSYQIEDILAASYTLPAPLTAINASGYGTYNWRVLVSLDNGATYQPATPPSRKVIITPSIPLAPVLTAPLNNSTTGDNTPLLDWNSSTSPLGGPFSYEVQVSTVATFATTVLTDSTPADDTDHQIGAALGDGAYFWRVRTINTFGAPSPYSAAFKFTVDTTLPAPPNQVNPAANGVTNLTRPTLTWAAVTGAVRYEVRLNQNNNCTTTLLINNPHSVVTPSLALAAAVLTAPLPQGDYYWCVQAIDAGGNNSGYAGPRKFTVNLANAPANNGTVLSPAGTTKPTFSWSTAGLPAGTTYNIRVFETDNFGGAPFYTIPSPIATLSHVSTIVFPHGDYYWQVVVNGVLPPDTVYNYFSVSPSTPAAPVLVAPLNNSFTNDPSPLLDWNATITPTGGPFSYELQIATTNTFAAGTIVEEGTTAVGDTDFDEIAPDLAPGPYFWRVRAKNTFGAYSLYSAVFKFTVDNVTPATPTQNLLAADAVTNLTRPTFTWTAATGAAKYNVVINDNNDCTTSPLVNYTTPTAVVSLNIAAAVSAQPLPQGDHYWCVRGVSAGGNNGAFAGPRKFTINLANTPNANLISAVALRPAFAWSAAGFAGATYTLRVYAGDDCTGGAVYTSPALTTVAHTIPAASAALNPGRYCWNVSVTGAPALPASVKRNFIITPALPLAPILVAPATSSSHATMPTLDWNDSTSTAGTPYKYTLEIANLPTFTPASIVRTVPDLTPTEYLIAPALPNGTYYWRVRTINSFGAAGLNSLVRSFIIDDQATVAPTLTAPANTSSTTAKLPVLTWSAPAGAVKYNLRFGTNDDLTAVQTITVNQLAVARFTPVSSLLATTYYWQVQALDAAGNPSPWSAKFSFKVTSLLTDSPVPNRYTDNTPLLTWGPISWAASGGYYEVMVDDNANFSSPIFQRTDALGNEVPGGTNNVEVTPALPNATYYWRVRACPAVGACGAWSSTGIFTIEN